MSINIFNPCMICGKTHDPHKCILPGLPGGLTLEEAKKRNLKLSPRIGTKK